MRLSSETRTCEELPLPYVIYPRGAFLVFQKEENADAYYMCSCMKKSVENYLELRGITHPDEVKLDVWNFPKTYVENLKKSIEFQAEGFRMHSWLDQIQFKDGLCHRCNKKRPQTSYCPESEGTVFRQAYGWYLDMKHYEYGVVPRLQRYLTDMESKQLHEIISFTYVSLLEDLMYDGSIEGLPEQTVKEWLEIHDQVWANGTPRIWDPQFPYNFVTALKKELEKRKTAVRRYIEDSIRADFEFQPLVGKWKSEQQLFEFVKKLAPKIKIKRNFRSKTLEHLEMDIWLPDFNIGIEYQGIQHYEPVKHWGGRRGLEKVQARDARKKELADENGITIVYFHHYEVLTIDLVYRRLKPHIDSIKEPARH